MRHLENNSGSEAWLGTSYVAPEHELLDEKQGRSRSRDEFGELAKLYRSLVFSVALRIVRNRQIAEDVAQETLLRAFMAWPDFRGECEPRVWLAKVATNLALNQQMRKREFSDSIPDHADEFDLQRRVEQTAMSSALRVAIHHLSPSLRQPLVMFEFDGIGCAEIGKRLGISPGAVRVRILRARRHLTNDMSPWT